MNDFCISPKYTPYINKSMEKITNIAKSNLFIGIGLLVISFFLIHKIIDVIILLCFIYLIYLLWRVHKEKIMDLLGRLPKPQYIKNLKDVYKPTENFSTLSPKGLKLASSLGELGTNNIYFDGLNDVISGNIEIPDRTKEIKKFNYQQDNAMTLASWNPNTYIKKIDENGKPIYDSIYNDNFPLMTHDVNLTEINPIDGTAENNFGMSLKELYDKSIPNYKKIEPKMTLNKSNDIIKTGASNLSSYTSEDWSYKNEKELNGGLIGDLHAFDANNDISNSVATF